MRTIDRKRFCWALAFLLVAMPVKANDKIMPSRIGDGLGVCVKWERTTPEELDQIKAAGFGIVRFDMRWEEVEKTQGVYNWKAFDRFITLLHDRRLRGMAILQGENEAYTKKVALPPSSGLGKLRLPAAPVSAKEVEAFAKFAATAAARYAGKDILWEIWNEPDVALFWPPKPDAKAFANLASATCQAMRETVPQATIIGPGLAHLPGQLDKVRPGFVGTLLSSPAASCFNALSVHPYRQNDETPETAQGDYERLRAFISAYTSPPDKPLPVISSEWGYTTLKISAEQQAAYALRTHFINLLNGVPVSIWYEWRDTDMAEDDSESHYGLLTKKGEKKLSIEAVKDFLPSIREATFEQRIFSTSEDDYFLLLRQPDKKYVLVYWTAIPQSSGERWLDLSVDSVNQKQRLLARPQLLFLGLSKPKISVVEVRAGQ